MKIKKLFKKLLPKRKLDRNSALAIALLPGIMLIVIHGIFTVTNIYEWYFPQLDIPMHILGGASVAWAAWALVYYARSVKKLPRLPFWFGALCAVGITAIVGVVWEFYEFIHDVLTGSLFQLGTADTMKDLADDLLGAFILSLLVGKKLLKK